MQFRNGLGPPWWRGRFRGCGYKITAARETILGVLSRAQTHLSAEDVYIKVHVENPEIGLATIYRTLDILTQLGLVQKFDFGDKRARYELAETEKGKNHHHHLVCTSCKKVIDYSDFIDEEIKLLKETEKVLSKKYNFDIKSHFVQFYGLCEKCKVKK